MKGKYTILKDESMSTIKRSVDVRLKEKVSEEDLRIIAQEIRAMKGAHDRTFIVYYLPGDQVGAGGWAMTHFNPDLQVRVLGTPLEEAGQ